MKRRKPRTYQLTGKELRAAHRRIKAGDRIQDVVAGLPVSWGSFINQFQKWFGYLPREARLRDERRRVDEALASGMNASQASVAVGLSLTVTRARALESGWSYGGHGEHGTWTKQPTSKGKTG
jgi:hypothetical protein